MKKAFLSLLIITNVFSVTAIAGDNVVTLFNNISIPKNTLIPSYHYRLSLSDYKIKYMGNKYVLQTPRDFLKKLIVDTRNGFIHISDYIGSETGYIILFCAYFVGNDKSKYLGISYYNGSRNYLDARWEFYMVENNKYTNVTEKIIKGFSEKLFINSHAKNDKTINTILKGKHLLLLPRYGTEINILLFDQTVHDSYIEVKRPPAGLTREGVLQLLKNVKFNLLTYKWNAGNNMFEKKSFKKIKSDMDYYDQYEKNVSK